jgi:preprotein translocase subunit SecY
MSTIGNVVKIPELRNKVLFTLGMVVLYRVGANVPVPGIDFDQVRQLQLQAESSGTLGLLNLFSGGALTQFAVFALGVMPYITASIIMQILGVVVPKLEQWQQQGAVGQRKITQWTRYITVAIALLQATGLTFLFGRGGGQSFLSANAPSVVLLPGFPWTRVLLCVLTLTAGTVLLMWMGELITQRGIGQGMSILIFASVVSSLPFLYTRLFNSNKTFFVLLMLVTLFTVVAIVIMEQGQRRIPVQFAKRVVGRRMYGGQSTYIPLKVNQAGVIPIIFASSVLYLPAILATVIQLDGAERWINDWLVRADSPLHMAFLALMIIGFAYFYTAIAFDPVKQADQIRKQGGFIPGIRPGEPTVNYLQKVLSRLTLPGAIFIAFIALLPSILLAFSGDPNLQIPFGGTTVLIAVGVALETMKQVNSQLMMRNYEGFLK